MTEASVDTFGVCYHCGEPIDGGFVTVWVDGAARHVHPTDERDCLAKLREAHR